MASRLPGDPPAEVTTTRRKRLTARQRLALYEAFDGKCAVCGGLLDGPKSAWIDEHLVPLALGGLNDMGNRGPVHEGCAREKTADDMQRVHKAKRQKAAHVGAKEPSGRWPSRTKPERRRRAPAQGRSELARRMKDKP